MLEPYDILKYPLVSEKSTFLAGERKYVFCVAGKATKQQIKQAVEAVYKVHVTGVAVIKVPAKKKMYRMRIEGYRPGYKKAIVTIREGEQIAIT